MNDLGLFIKNEKILVSSLMVADKYSKEHKHITRDIKALIKAIPDAQSNFGLTSYEDSQGRKQPCYEMDRQGFSMLVMSFTGAEAKKFTYQYTLAFEKMLEERQAAKKTEVVPIKNEMDTLRMFFNVLEHHHTKINRHDNEIADLDERLTKIENVKEADIIEARTVKSSQYVKKNIYSPTSIAKAFGLSATALNEILAADGIIKRVRVYSIVTGQTKAHWIITDKYRSLKYSVQKYAGIRSNGGTFPTEVTYAWTAKGVGFIVNILKYKGYTQRGEINNKTKARNQTKAAH